MHNITSRNQLDEWRHFEKTLEDQQLNDYYECLIECDIQHQPKCKSMCARILMWETTNITCSREIRKGLFFVKYLLY